MPNNTFLAVFSTTHETLRAEEILQENNIEIKPVIKPSNISSKCGMALEFNKCYNEKLIKICYDCKLNLLGVY